MTVALALLLAALGTAGVLGYVHQANTRALAGQKAVSVLVATKTIPSGTTAHTAVQDGMLSSQKLPASSVPSDSVSVITGELAGLVLSADMAPGQLLLLPMLVTATQATSGLAVPAGMVAVSINLCLPEVVAGSVRAGSRVAVFDTYGSGSTLTAQANCNGPHQQQDLGAVHTQIVLPSVLVLSVGQAAAIGQSATSATSASQNSSTSASPGNVLVTLAVNQSDAERVIQLTEAGLPYLALLTNSSGTKPDTTIVPLLPPLK
jgi:pilus assembly protein CpaB